MPVEFVALSRSHYPNIVCNTLFLKAIFHKRQICLYTSFILRHNECNGQGLEHLTNVARLKYICILDIHIDNWHFFNFNSEIEENWEKHGK